MKFIIIILLTLNIVYAEEFIQVNKIKKCINLELNIQKTQNTLDVYSTKLMQFDEHINEFNKVIKITQLRLDKELVYEFEKKAVRENLLKLNKLHMNAKVKKDNMLNVDFTPLYNTQKFHIAKFEELCTSERVMNKDLILACKETLNSNNSVFCKAISHSDEDQKKMREFIYNNCGEREFLDNPILRSFCEG